MRQNVLIAAAVLLSTAVTFCSNAQNNPTRHPGINTTINSPRGSVPAGSILFADNFDSTRVDSFPSRWRTNRSGKVVTPQPYPGKWLSLVNEGFYIPKLKDGLSADFTVEFDLIVADGQKAVPIFYILFEAALNSGFDLLPANTYLQCALYPDGAAHLYHEHGHSGLYASVRSDEYNIAGKINHLIFRKQGEGLQVYINHEKLFESNHAFDGDKTYSTFKFGSTFGEPARLLLSNFKIASL